MKELLAACDADVNFLVLLIGQLAADGALDLCAVAYLSSGQTIRCEVVPETEGATF